MILITGTGRCGTGYVAQALTSAGVACAHEGVFSRKAKWGTAEQLRAFLARPMPAAVCTFRAAPFLAGCGATRIVHLVRHPRRQMASNIAVTAATMARRKKRWGEWMIPHVPELLAWKRAIDKAACWYVRVNAMIEPHAHIFHRVEDDVRLLLDKLGIDYQGNVLFADTTYNTRSIPLPKVRLADISEPLRSELAAMARRYGYE